MADTFVEADPGTGGEKFAVDDDGAKKHPYAKLEWGPSGTQTHVDVGAGAVPIQDGGNSITVDGTVSVGAIPTLPAGSNNIGDVDVLTIAPGDNNIGNVDVVSLPALPAGTNNIGDVDVLTLPPIPAGTNNIGDVDVLTLPPLPAGSNNIGDVDVLTMPGIVGSVAHDSPGAAVVPVAVGGYASAAAPTDVSTDVDIVRAWRLRNGAAATVVTAAGALIGGDAANGLDVDVTRMPALVASSANIGDVDVLTVPADPFGVNADAASATGSISAKLRQLAANGIIVLTLPAKKMTYAASQAVTVTNLHSIATSAAWLAGWEGGAIDNSSLLYFDYAVNAKIVVAAAGLAAGEIRLYLVAEMDDSTWPDVFDGTESVETITIAAMRDAICRLAAVTTTDATASRTYPLQCPSAATVFGGTLPRKFVPFITHSTGANLAASGSAVYVRGAYFT